MIDDLNSLAAVVAVVMTCVAFFFERRAYHYKRRLEALRERLQPEVDPHKLGYEMVSKYMQQHHVDTAFGRPRYGDDIHFKLDPKLTAPDVPYIMIDFGFGIVLRGYPPSDLSESDRHLLRKARCAGTVTDANNETWWVWDLGGGSPVAPFYMVTDRRHDDMRSTYTWMPRHVFERIGDVAGPEDAAPPPISA